MFYSDFFLQTNQTYPDVESIAIPGGVPTVFVKTLLSFPSKVATEIHFDEDSVQNMRRPIQSIAIFSTFAFFMMTFNSTRFISLIQIPSLFAKYNFISTVSIAIALLDPASPPVRTPFFPVDK